MAERRPLGREVLGRVVELLLQFRDAVAREEIAEALVDRRQVKRRFLAGAEAVMLAHQSSVELGVIAAVLVEHRDLGSADGLNIGRGGRRVKKAGGRSRTQDKK